MDRSIVLRLLDVNFNRAAEGLRTLDDIARVVRQDIAAAGWVKSLRHELASVAAGLPRHERLAAREVHSDSGTNLTDKAELFRGDWSDVVVAAAERATQSLRVIEEVSKIHFPNVSAECKQFRYRAYDRLAQVERQLANPQMRFLAPALYVLVDCSMSVESFVLRLRQLKEAGVGLFQIRDKELEGAELLRFSRAAVAEVGADRVVVNDRVDIALACGARGVHIGQEDLPIEAVQAIAKDRLWIGISTHDVFQARKAQAAGADYIGCGPTFPSQTKRFEQFAGVEFLREVASEIDVPAYAIGGITIGNIGEVVSAGINRVAVSGAVWHSVDPVARAVQLTSALNIALGGPAVAGPNGRQPP